MRRVAALLLLVAAATALAETRALIVAGLGGGPPYQEEFRRQAEAGAAALADVSQDVTLLVGDSATAERIQQEIEALAERGAAGDTLVVLLIGHGSYDERDYRFNVPGEDVTGRELTRWLSALPPVDQVVLAATSASGALQPLLEAEHRTLITATRNGGERNVTVFGRYFTEALASSAADVDKDGYVSTAEAFRFAETRVADHYRERKQMATEHPVLEGPENRLSLARLDGAPTFRVGTEAERGRLEALEAQIEALRADKEKLGSDDYYAELQRLLLDMALLRRQLAAEDEP